MTFFIALGIVLVGSTAVLGWQYATRMLAPRDHIDDLEPLSQGRRPNDGWGKQ